MNTTTCRVCQEAIGMEAGPFVGQFIACKNCGSLYEVLGSEPLELRLVGNTGDLDLDEEAAD